MTSQYNVDGPVPGPSNLANLIMKRARMEGFLCTDYMHRAEEKYRVDVVQGLENAPRALHKLFDGSNTGKLIVQAGPELKLIANRAGASGEAPQGNQKDTEKKQKDRQHASAGAGQRRTRSCFHGFTIHCGHKPKMAIQLHSVRES